MSDVVRILLHTDAPNGLVDTLHARLPDAQVEVCETYAGVPDALARFRPDIVYTVRFAGTPGYPRDALFGPDGPAWVANGGVGIDHFGAWDPARTTVTNAAGVAADMMAEYVMGGFLHFMLDVPGLQADKGARFWGPRTVRPLKGKTVLIIGLGHTGRAVAKRAKAFGMSVIGTRATPREMEHVDQVFAASDLDHALPQADFIAIATPLIPQTRGLIGAPQIALMKQGVVIADVSRGGVVDNAALHAALVRGHVGGAALDVFETEPLPKTSPLWALDNVILSPHCSSVHDGWEDASFELFLDNVSLWVAGQPVFNVVDPMRGY